MIRVIATILLLACLGCGSSNYQNRAYLFGVECGRNGTSSNANPYTYQDDKKEWLRGWIDGKKNSKVE